jgi:hypothetical protein
MIPDVFLFCLCDQVEADPKNPLRMNVQGIFRKLRSTTDPPFPCWCRRLTAFAFLNFNGEAEIFWRIVEVNGNLLFYRRPPVRTRFVAAPTHAIPWASTVRRVRFRRPGEYRAELVFDGNVVARWTFFVTA